MPRNTTKMAPCRDEQSARALSQCPSVPRSTCTVKNISAIIAEYDLEVALGQTRVL